MAEEVVQVEGKIVQVLPGTMFRVELENGHQVLAGDKVRIEMSPYDTEKARIVYRLRNSAQARNAPIRSYGPRRRK